VAVAGVVVDVGVVGRLRLAEDAGPADLRLGERELGVEVGFY